MKTAVLYTGALRTIQKTIGYFKRHVLIHPDVHVFACLQNDSPHSIIEIEKWLQYELSPHLVSLHWFDIQDHSEFIILREKNLNVTTLSNQWKDYLRNSGSILEYLQLHQVYKQLYLREQIHTMNYDYIIRMRPDNMFAKPIDFHWLHWTEQEIEARVQKIQEQMKHDGIECNPESTLSYFMNTMLDDSLIQNIKLITGQFIKNKRVPIPSTTKELQDYIQHGSYILTYRANNLYIVRREWFHMIPSIFCMYGLLKRTFDDPYWFNAENHFQAACIHSGLAIHDYNTLFEDKSLYEYDEKKYFDEHCKIINPMMVYCLVRR